MKIQEDREVAMRYPRYALISVADKTGIENVSRALSDFGFEILSKGETAEGLMSSGIPVKEISDYTGFPDILDGDITSLHPSVFGAIMARDTQQHSNELAQIKANYVDIVICNLHSQRQLSTGPSTSLRELADRIDLVGPALLRAAAKNFERVATICDSDKYEELLWYLASNGEVPQEIRFEWAKRAFEHAITYDSMVYTMLTDYDLNTGKRRMGKSCEY